MKVLKFISLSLGSLLLLGVIGAIVYALLKISFYDQKDNSAHLEIKQQYLAELAERPAPQSRPNIVLVMFDDLGYEDLGAFGSTVIRTPRIDKLADEGIKLTQYFSPSPVCTPSRASMLTGRYPPKTGLPSVVFPEAHRMTKVMKLRGMNTRLPLEEITVAEVLKASGYRTGMVGKWHLGDHDGSLPNNFGFDYFYGPLYSNDMLPMEMYENADMVEPEPDQNNLSADYSSRALDFIDKAGEDPFFVYLAHNYPHIPLYSSPEHAGESDAGLYGDVVEDLDRSVGQLVDGLKARGLAENTLLIITSDNGPWFQGSAGEARGRKGNTFDGGVHVPFIARWPQKIQASLVSDSLTSGIDVMPTVLDLLNLPAPADRSIDGVSMLPIFEGKPAAQERELQLYSGKSLFSIRESTFKYHTRKPVVYDIVSNLPFVPAVKKGPWLFNVSSDAKESYDVSHKYPQKMAEYSKRIEALKVQQSENPRGWID